MTNRVLLTASVAWAALSGSAMADVTVQQVWSEWQKTLEQTYGGYTATSEDLTDTALTVTDLTVTVNDADMRAEVVVPNLSMVANDDGSVSIETSPQYDARIWADDGDSAVAVTLAIRQVGAVMTVNGDADEMFHDYTADALTIVLEDIEAEGHEDLDLAFDLTLNDVDADATINQQGLSESVRAADSTVMINFKDPKTQNGFNVNGSIETIEFGFETQGDLSIVQDLDHMARTGSGLNGYSSNGAGRLNISSTMEDKPINAIMTFGAGDTRYDLGPEGMRYVTSSNDLSIQVETPDFPAPIDVTMGEMSANLAAPILPGDTPEPVALGIALRDFTMSDALWDIFDPASVLPRIPATIALGLEGEGHLMAPVFDNSKADEIEEMFEEGNPPATLDNLRLTELQVTAAGVSITGKGEMTFDNDDLETFNGFPRPQGSVSLRGVGLNALLDNLGQMGILPPEQLMGPRMMLSMFTVVEDKDTLTSTLEIKEKGQIFANGQRIR